MQPLSFNAFRPAQNQPALKKPAFGKVSDTFKDPQAPALHGQFTCERLDIHSLEGVRSREVPFVAYYPPASVDGQADRALEVHTPMDDAYTFTVSPKTSILNGAAAITCKTGQVFSDLPTTVFDDLRHIKDLFDTAYSVDEEQPTPLPRVTQEQADSLTVSA